MLNMLIHWKDYFNLKIKHNTKKERNDLIDFYTNAMANDMNASVKILVLYLITIMMNIREEFSIV
jgi:hypothetical protein